MAKSELIARVIEEDAAQVRRGTLQSDCAGRLFGNLLRPIRGVVLLLHGFGGGTYQYDDLGPALAQEGLHAFAPRLPGHGARDAAGRANSRDLPRSTQTNRYGEAARAFLQLVTELAHRYHVPVGIFGFSLGGSLALDLALNYPAAVSRVMLAAPLLRRAAVRGRRMHRLLRSGSLLGLRRFYDFVPYSYGVSEATPGHSAFRIGQLFAALDYARSVHPRGRVLTVPTQIVVTEGDGMCNAAMARELLACCAKPSWLFEFPASQAVPHTMLCRRDLSPAQAVQQIADIARRFFLEGEGLAG